MKRYIILENDIPYDWDDYGVFGAVLYDTEADKIIIDKYGHGTGSEFAADEIKLDDALAEQPELEPKIKAACMMYANIEETITYRHDKPINIPCKVGSRCRLLPGGTKCILLRMVPEIDRRVTWKTEYIYKYEVYAPSLNRKVRLTARPDIDKDAIEKLRERVVASLMKKSIKELAHLHAYGMSYCHSDYEYLQSIRERYVKDCLPYAEAPDMTGCNDPQYERKKAAKMPSLIDWARSAHPEYNEAQVYDLAERVYKKRYA